MPCAVVEVADLFLILHHAGWFALLLVFQSNVVLDSLKVLPMLIQSLEESIFVLCAPRFPLPPDLLPFLLFSR